MRLAAITRSRERSEGGVWWNFETGEILREPHAKDLSVLVAEAQNPRFRSELQRLRLRDQHILRAAGDKWAAELQKLTDEAAAATVLLDWRNLEGDDGQPVPYSREKALEILRDPSLWQFRQAVLDFAQHGVAYRKEAEEAALGN